MKIIALQLIVLSLLITHGILAQGPPIRLDKPIMLGAGETTVRALFNHVNSDYLDYSSLILEGDYNINRSTAVGLTVPWVFNHDLGGNRLGDVALMGKYQFIQKDKMGQSTRVAAKVKQMFPTGASLGIPEIGMDHYKTYAGFAGAYESLKIGVQAELGYDVVHGLSHHNYLSYKLGVAVPLLEPSYPANQINVYLETEGMNMRSGEEGAQYGYYIAPGLQYARGKFTVETSIQFTVAENLPLTYGRNWSLLFGGRMVL